MTTYDGNWLAAVRDSLRELAETTGTSPDSPMMLDHYLRQIHTVASGPRSELVIAEACARVGRAWRYPSFPKLGDILEAIASVRSDHGFLESIREKDPARLLEEQDTARKAAYTPEELAYTQGVIAEYKRRNGLCGPRDGSSGGAGSEREQGGCNANPL